MAQKPQFRYDRDGRVRSFFQLQAEYASDDIDRFREHVELERARRLTTARKRASNIPSGMGEFLADEAQELDTVSYLADELSIVALYRVVEINTARIVAYEFGPTFKTKASYIARLKKLLRERKGIALDKVPHYEAINELRLLNNAIKHAGEVTEELANAYPRWHKGGRLTGLDKAYKRLRPKVPIYILRLAERMDLRYKSPT